MTEETAIVWFRSDLRLQDQPALAAAGRHDRIVPVFIWAPDEEGDWAPGGASRWYLHHSLQSLERDLQSRDLKLILRNGPSLDALKQLAKETGTTHVYWNRRYEPAIRDRDATIEEALRNDGLTVETFNASLLFEPWDIENKSGKPFQVFTPFWKTCLSKDPGETAYVRITASGPKSWPKSVDLDTWKLTPDIPWDEGLAKTWTPGSDNAKRRLKRFLDRSLKAYPRDRDRLDLEATSTLSPSLHFGEIGPRQIWETTHEALKENGADRQGANKFLAEVGWREFAHHLLHHFPTTPDQSLRENFRDFPWETDATALKAWQRGKTGYPVVDAAMRNLWATGTMPNRSRMIVASFLTKHLLIPWQEGAQWFWDTLVDADLASNTLGWQWTAGCGADAAPYFRIFNPITQGEKFDPDGDFTRTWIPELAKLDTKWLFEPWEAPDEALQEAGVELGSTYPKPIVEHGKARNRALRAYDEIKGSGS